MKFKTLLFCLLFCPLSLFAQLSSSDDVIITVNPVPNQPPQVSAGPDQTVTLPNGVSLTATATDDGLPAGSTIGYQWVKVSGPGTVTFANPTSRTTTATFSVSGSYVLRFTATEVLGQAGNGGSENGPFPGWTNVRTLGAKGDGVADDTAAIQAALNGLRSSKPVVFFPSNSSTATLIVKAK